MGLETYFKIRKTNVKIEDIKTVEQYNLLYTDLLTLGRPSNEVEELIFNISTIPNKICYIGYLKDKNGSLDFSKKIVKVAKPEQDTCFLIDLEKMKQLTNNLDNLASICHRYSDRIIYNLAENLDVTEIKKFDLKLIRDELFKLNEFCGLDDIYHLLKIHDFFRQFFITDFMDKENPMIELYYCRSF